MSDNHSSLTLMAGDTSYVDPLIHQGLLSVISSLTLVSDQGFSHEASRGSRRSAVVPRCLIWWNIVLSSHTWPLYEIRKAPGLCDLFSNVCFPDRTGWDPDMHWLYACDPKSPGRFYQVRPTPGPHTKCLQQALHLGQVRHGWNDYSSIWGAWHPYWVPQAPSKWDIVFGETEHEHLPGCTADGSAETGGCAPQPLLAVGCLAQHYLGHIYIYWDLFLYRHSPLYLN